MEDILERAKVVIVMFDEDQILTTEQYLEDELLEKYKKQAKDNDNYVKLENQLRMHANEEVIEWIRKFTKEGIVEKMPDDLGDYDIQVFDTPEELDRKSKRRIKNLSWAEQPQTIKEVGSTYTIQGFDLNYAGVILGPSVKYRNGHIIFDTSKSCNEKAIRNRTLSDGTSKKFGEKLLKHEVRILMTRGVNGLCIYACDKELREHLKKCSKTSI